MWARHCICKHWPVACSRTRKLLCNLLAVACLTRAAKPHLQISFNDFLRRCEVLEVELDGKPVHVGRMSARDTTKMKVRGGVVRFKIQLSAPTLAALVTIWLSVLNLRINFLAAHFVRAADLKSTSFCLATMSIVVSMSRQYIGPL